MEGKVQTGFRQVSGRLNSHRPEGTRQLGKARFCSGEHVKGLHCSEAGEAD